jgi:phospholipid transport system substrate-binding protein
MQIFRLRVPFVVFAGFLASAVAWAGIEDDASVFVDGHGTELIEILDLPQGQERRSHFQTWLSDTFNLDALANLALGPYLGTATDDQMAAYEEAFARYIVVTYEARFDTFSGYDFSVVRARPMGDDDAIVRTNIAGPDGNSYVVDFRVELYEDATFQVIDVAVEGLSMLKTQRDEFSAVIQRDGIDGLITSLNERTALVEDSSN